MGFSSKEYWNGLPFPFPEGLPDPGIKPGLLHCRQILSRLSYREILDGVNVSTFSLTVCCFDVYLGN